MTSASRQSVATGRWRLHALTALALIALSGCRPHVSDCVAPADDSARLYLDAMDSLERSELDAVERSLDRLLHCQPDFHAAVSARALALALRARAAGDPSQRAAYQQRARAELAAGEARVRNATERFLHGVTAIRTLTVLQDSQWLASASEAYEATRALSPEEPSLLYYREREALPYFMAEALAAAGEYEKARALYAEVFARHGVGRWNGQAEAAWRRTDKIVRATGGITPHGLGRKIAAQPSLSRAQLAAVLVEELELGKILDERVGTARGTRRAAPADVREHPYRDQIVTVLGWEVRGIELVYDAAAQAYLFQPEAAVRRKELAIVLEDLLIRITGDQSIARAFVGQEQPLFSDVQPTAAWYNACATAVSRGLLEGDLRGAFRPDDEVEGADALLALRALGQKITRK
ncbi:MAG: S-layer homology domain-containing protein [Deltaproteobacteria bacterium]|nr:S-layer homology domain-containing protein [Deltaproteobacteria bacterium]